MYRLLPIVCLVGLMCLDVTDLTAQRTTGRLVDCHPPNNPYAADSTKCKPWYVWTKNLGEVNKILIPGSGPDTVTLRGGWVCVIGGPTQSNTRLTACSKRNDRVDFFVQCDAQRPQEHVQLRFNRGAKEIEDFIEVGCTV